MFDNLFFSLHEQFCTRMGWHAYFYLFKFFVALELFGFNIF